jgi:BirA family biotin operon repressor/biotin-[acetyl-CoA-carboxylase] ligase
LEVLGLEIESVKGRGYRIPGGIDLIDEVRIRSTMSATGLRLLSELNIDEVIDSTNMEALRRIQQGARSGLVCTAEQQTAGRGRRGRYWVSPFARNLYVSTIWEFSQGATALEGLSLAVGVAVANALKNLGLPEVQLKWPNDILYNGKKLGGVLLEMVGDTTGQCQVVVGIGINVTMPDAAARAIDQDWADVFAMSPQGNAPGRNEILGSLLNHLLPLLAEYESAGFGPWREAWQDLHAHAGKSVILSTGAGKTAGVAAGVDSRGALQLETSVGVQSIFGGEVSLRVAE